MIFGLWLVRLEPSQIRSVCERVRHPSESTEGILAANSLIASSDKLCNAKPSQVTEALDEYPLKSIAISYLAVEEGNLRQVLREYFEKYRFIQSKLNGDDLRVSGLPPGPVYRRILSQLRSGWLDGDIRSMEQEKELFDHLVTEALGPG